MYELIKGTGSGMMDMFAIKQQFPECFPELSVEEILIAYIADILLFSPLYSNGLTCIAEPMKEKDICIKHTQPF
jgi:hypothetical protein